MTLAGPAEVAAAADRPARVDASPPAARGALPLEVLATWEEVCGAALPAPPGEGRV